MRKTHQTAKWLLMITVILFWTTGCGLLALNEQDFSSEEDIQTQVAGTMTALQVVDTLEVPLEMPETTEANPLIATTSPTLTLSPTITLTSTLEVPMVSVSRNTNCRKGPGEDYGIPGALLEGEQAEVVGQYADGQFWIIQNPDGDGECWLWGYYATVTGPTEGLPVYTPPPTPTPAFDWGGTWSVSIGPAEGGIYTTRTMTAAVTGKAFTASIDFGGPIITYTGTISDDYLSVSGTWQENVDETGPFKFYALGVNQFQGNFTDGPAFGLCGVKGGGGFPSPCYRP